MTDGFAFLIVLTGAVFLVLLTFFSNGNYQESITLKAGRYRAGYDIPSGKCDLRAVSGGGNFIVFSRQGNNWNVGNAIGASSSFQASQFRNLTLRKGDILEINSGVEIMLTPPDPILNPGEDTLSPGIYRFGVDVPQGRYDLEAVSGDGDVLLVEVKKDRYVFYQDMSLENPFKAGSFKNLTCTREFELWINGNLHIKLHRSKKQPLSLRLSEWFHFE